MPPGAAPIVYVAPVRLTPPTTGTFTLAVLAVAAGVGIHLGWVDVLTAYDFWLVTGGAALLILGVVFKRI
jgi:hypothetical protein